MKNGEHIDCNGTIRWYKDGLLHREDGPAVIWEDGEKYWYQNGILHREDGPAIVFEEVHSEYYLSGEYFVFAEFAAKVGWTDKQIATYLLSKS